MTVARVVEDSKILLEFASLKQSRASDFRNT